MRTGWANADAEQIKNTDRHGSSLPLAAAGRNEPCRLIPGRARKDTLSLLPGLISAWQRHAPGPSMGSNYLDTPLIPDDTPVTEKRQRSLLPSGFRRHITDLRHTASFGS